MLRHLSPGWLKLHLQRCLVPEWEDQQVYPHPYLKELTLRNHM
jgi:hypothetical protein